MSARGDRFVLRRETTVGGGRVLDPAPPRRPDESRLRLLDQDDPRALVAGLVGAPVRVDALRRRALLDGDRARRGPRRGRSGRGSGRSAPRGSSGRGSRAEEALAARADELDPGLPAAALLGREPWAAAVAPLLGLDASDGKLYLPGTRPSAAGRGGDLERRLAENGLEPTPVEDGELAIQLEREGRLVRLGDGLAVAPDAYERARSALVAECERAGTISLARFRDLLGASRRVAQLLLERFDADRLTIRVGDERRLRRSAPGIGSAAERRGPVAQPVFKTGEVV